MNRLRRALRPEQIRELILVLLVVAAILFFGSQINNYYTGRTFTRISSSLAILVVVAVGQTLVVVTRNIDLSVGSIVGFTAYAVGTQLALDNDMSPILVVLLAVGIGGLMGLVNGALVAYGKVPSIIVTLGTLALYRTMLIEYANSKTVTTDSLPDWVVNISSANFFSIGELDIRVIFVVALVSVLVFQLALSYLNFGRRLYAIGSNPEAARQAGLPTSQTLLAAYGLCGALAGLGGFMFLGRFGNITVVAGQGMELQVVAAVVVGGVNIFGGSGTLVGALLGAILITTLEQSLIRWLQISEFWRDAILGFLILLAVASDALILNRLRRLWQLRDETAPGETQPASTGRTS